MASVLCCYIRDFLLAGAGSDPAAPPLALVGADGCVWAATPAAVRSGVRVGMRPQAGRLACPELRLQPLDLAGSQLRQEALLAALGAWELPVEAQGWGLAYIDLRGVAECAATVRPLGADLGRRVRAALGARLQPALGWGASKFTGRVAAMQTAPGRMKLVAPPETARFLSGQPVALLPLADAHLRQLHWLGIRTLGQFARLPAAAVWQRFGAAGKLAQQWARGKDERPVCGAVPQPQPPVTVILDPPATRVDMAVADVMASLRPLLAALAERMEGVLRLHLACRFDDGREQDGVIDFVAPAHQVERLQAAVTQQLCAQPWRAPLAVVRWTLLASGEVAVAQLRLFADPDADAASPGDLVGTLAARYGAVFFRAQRHNAGHPVAERRGQFVGLAQQAPVGHVPALA